MVYTCMQATVEEGELASARKSYLALEPENRVADGGEEVNNKREEEKRHGGRGKKKKQIEIKECEGYSGAQMGNKWGKEVGKEGDETRGERGGG